MAFGAHPFVTDDAGTQGTGNWQLELMAQHDRHDLTADPGSGLVRQRSRSTLFNPVLDLDIGPRKGLNRAEADTVLLVGAAFRW